MTKGKEVSADGMIQAAHNLIHYYMGLQQLLKSRLLISLTPWIE